MRFVVHFAFAGCQDGGIRPRFFDHVEFVDRGLVSVRKVLHDRVVWLGDVDLVVTFVFVSSAGHTEKLSPVIDGSITVGVHGAVNHHGVGAGVMGSRDATDVVMVFCFRKTLVMDDDVESPGPVWVFVEFDFGFGARASFIDNCPGNVDPVSLECQLHRFRLQVVVVAASTGDQEHFDRRFVCECEIRPECQREQAECDAGESSALGWAHGGLDGRWCG